MNPPSYEDLMQFCEETLQRARRNKKIPIYWKLNNFAYDTMKKSLRQLKLHPIKTILGIPVIIQLLPPKIYDDCENSDYPFYTFKRGIMLVVSSEDDISPEDYEFAK